MNLVRSILFHLSLRLFAALGAGSVAFSGEAAPSNSSARPPSHRIADLELELIWVEPGTFMMGSPQDEPQRNKAEGPPIPVTLSRGFWLGKTEVTQAQYEAVMGTNPSTFKHLGGTAPVERVSWGEAMEFCRKLTTREREAGRLPKGYEFTLPTEAQWEYAYRAGTTGTYPGEPNAMGWFKGNSDDSTHVVATKSPNAWGFHDMGGNVLEWCLDWYGRYPRSPATDPAGPERGHYRIARGGSWRAGVEVARSAARAGGSAGRLDYTMGFRVALSSKR